MLKLAGVIILNKKQEVLLLHRNTIKRMQWEIPGGKVERGESYEETAIREAREELCIDVKIVRKIGDKDFYEDEQIMNYTWFLAIIDNGIPRVVETDKFDKIK